MRLWTGINVIYGNDQFGQGIIMQGDKNAVMAIPGKKWELDPGSSDAARVWRPLNATTMERILPPLPADLPTILKKLFSTFHPEKNHPAFIAGFEKEAQRIFPAIADDVAKQFYEFVAYLKKEYQLQDKIETATILVPYADGYGPDLVVRLDGEATLLPEIPPVYLVPENWITTGYIALTGMNGPNINKDLPLKERLSFSGNFKPADKPTEALLYFHAARAMAAWAAWVGDPHANFLAALIEMITQGYRPLPSE